MSRNVLPITRHTDPPVDRGRLLSAAAVAALFFCGEVEPRWVMEHVHPKVRFGHRTVFFFEKDVQDWIESHREEVA